MKGYNYKSVKQVIGELYDTYNITQDDFVEKVNRFTARALGIMKIRSAYTRQYKKVLVQERKAKIPCDSKMVLAVVLPIPNICRIPITNSWSLGNTFADIPLHSIYKGGFDAGWLVTNFDNEEVLFVYNAYPCDKDGYLLIPDEEMLFEALNFFIIYQLALGGYKHPVITMQYAEAKWEKLYPQARNTINAMTPEEADRLLKMRTNPLFVDVLREDWNINIDAIEDLNINEFKEELNRLYISNT